MLLLVLVVVVCSDGVDTSESRNRTASMTLSIPAPVSRCFLFPVSGLQSIPSPILWYDLGLTRPPPLPPTSPPVLWSLLVPFYAADRRGPQAPHSIHLPSSPHSVEVYSRPGLAHRPSARMQSPGGIARSPPCLPHCETSGMKPGVRAYVACGGRNGNAKRACSAGPAASCIVVGLWFRTQGPN